MYKKFKQLHHFFFILFLLICSLVFFKVISGFMLAVFWATVFSICFYSLYEKICEKCNNRKNLAAFLSVSLIFFMVLIPIMAMGYAVVLESIEVYDLVKDENINFFQPIQLIEEKVPYLETTLNSLGTSPNELIQFLKSALSNLLKSIADQGLKVSQSILGVIVQCFLTLYLLFFFFRDGKEITQGIIDVVPLGNRKENLLIKKFSAAIKATAKGTFSVALAQGFLGGLMFFILGIQAPVLWGGMMAALSLLPVGGAAIIWGPTAIYLLINGSVAKGITMLVIGSLGIGLLDNLLRPILVGKHTKMPDYLILITTFGGIQWFGITGFIIGPVIAVLFVVSWQIAGQLYGGKEF